MDKLTRNEKLAHPLVTAAASFAAIKHAGQLSKHIHTPYIMHCTLVALEVANLEDSTPEMIAAAYLHDTIEDTGVLMSELVEKFGQHVAELVVELTDHFADHSLGNRATRKAMELERSKLCSPESQTIKYADCIANIRTIMPNATDPEYQFRFTKEMSNLWEALDKGDAGLRDKLQKEIVFNWLTRALM